MNLLAQLQLRQGLVATIGGQALRTLNPARSTGPALFVGGWALAQLWLFWVAPIAGALLAGFLGSWLHEDDKA